MRVAYVGNFQFPELDAGSGRVLGIAKALRMEGHSVFFFGSEKSIASNEKIKKRPQLNTQTYQGFEYLSPESGRSGIIGILSRQSSIFTGTSILKRLKIEEKEDGPFDAVIAYQPSSILTIRLMRWCRSRRIALICDIVEWYDPRQLSMGYFGPFYWDSEFRMRCLLKHVKWLICISKFLTEHYKAYNCNVIRVPILIDKDQLPIKTYRSPNIESDVVLIYAGNPGRKDLLGNVLYGIERLRGEGVRISIKLIGLTEKDVLRYLNNNLDLYIQIKESIILVPRVPRTEVHTQLSYADFVPLLRPNKKYANAGFPTKIVESFAAGVPVIANITGDLGDFLEEGHNAFIVSDSGVETFVKAVLRSINEKQHWPAMRLAARKSAEDFFSINLYSKGISDFLYDAVQSARGN